MMFTPSAREGAVVLSSNRHLTHANVPPSGFSRSSPVLPCLFGLTEENWLLGRLWFVHTDGRCTPCGFGTTEYMSVGVTWFKVYFMPQVSMIILLWHLNQNKRNREKQETNVILSYTTIPIQRSYPICHYNPAHHVVAMRRCFSLPPSFRIWPLEQDCVFIVWRYLQYYTWRYPDIIINTRITI